MDVLMPLWMQLSGWWLELNTNEQMIILGLIWLVGAFVAAFLMRLFRWNDDGTAGLFALIWPFILFVACVFGPLGGLFYILTRIATPSKNDGTLWGESMRDD